MTQLEDLVARVETWKALDRVAEPLARAVGRAVRPTPVRNVLSGTVIGHPLHPLLTDVPIGAWTMAAVLDLAGGPRTARAADVLVAAGLAAAVPTAATGLNDWSDTQGADRRIGLVHATANSVALTFYAASLAARLTSPGPVTVRHERPRAVQSVRSGPGHRHAGGRRHGGRRCAAR